MYENNSRVHLSILRNKHRTNGELISVRKHNYNCMLDDGIY